MPTAYQHVVVVWWTYWNYRSIEDWTFFRFAAYLSPTVAFFTFALYGVLAGLRR